jgi:hypothetical protein
MADRPKANQKPDIGPLPSLRVSLANYGLAAEYMKHDEDDCSAHVIGYRFVVWLDNNLVAVGFNTSPDCRIHEKPVSGGMLRLLEFDQFGKVNAKRDVPYDADGGDEIVAPGEGMRGPGDTLLLRIEESGSSKSGVLLLDKHLRDISRIDRFMESPSVIDRSVEFQEGFVLHGPRIYDVYDGSPLSQVAKITADWPVGTMDQRVGRSGITYSLCAQELSPGNYSSTSVIYSGAHRRCTLMVRNEDNTSWHAELSQDQVVQIFGTFADGRVAGIVRQSKMPDRMMLWRATSQAEELPWFPMGYDTALLGEAGGMVRYAGVGRRIDSEKVTSRLMIFDRNVRVPLVDRSLSSGAHIALSPDGLKYAAFEAGRLMIYSLESPPEHVHP